MSLENEIESLRNKLIELENKKQKEHEYNEKNNIEMNLNIIQKGIDEKTYKVNANRYSKSCVVSKFHDQELIPQLQAIHNILTVLNKKVNDLEKN